MESESVNHKLLKYFNFDAGTLSLSAFYQALECSLIPKEHLIVSGDGTAVHTHASPRGHHWDGAPQNLRHFYDPDAS